MADNMTDAEERRILDLSVPDDTLWLALYTATPTDSATGTEVVGGVGYARVLVSFSAASTSAGVTSKVNDTTLTFPTATGSWGTVTSWGLMDATTAGNQRWYGPLGTSKAFGSGDIAQFAPGSFSVGIS